LSNYLAIATVTEALKQLLTNGIRKDGLNASVIAQPPDVVIRGTPDNILNLFLYRVTPNIGYVNLDLPARSSQRPSSLVKTPQLGLDLHYIITALGSDNDDLLAHQILASAMRILHENPVLTRGIIRDTIKAKASLKDSDLAHQIELVKIVHQNLTLEEITKLWSSFFQTSYRISATYQATVVLLESAYEPKPTLPVLTPQIKMAMEFKQPLIRQVQPLVLEYSANAKLRLIGQNFYAEKLAVQFGDLPPVSPDVATDSEIVVTLPSGMTSGVKKVQVIQNLSLKVGADQPVHKVFESNIIPFMLAPMITDPAPIHVVRGTELTLHLEPCVTADQKASFIVGDYDIPVPQREHGSPPVNQLSAIVPLKLPVGMVPQNFPTGTFLLRIRVDGAESFLKVENGLFVSPTIQVA